MKTYCYKYIHTYMCIYKKREISCLGGVPRKRNKKNRIRGKNHHFEAIIINQVGIMDSSKDTG